MTEYYRPREAAEKMSVSTGTVLAWVKSGKLESVRTPGGHIRIPAEAVTRFFTAAS